MLKIQNVCVSTEKYENRVEINEIWIQKFKYYSI